MPGLTISYVKGSSGIVVPVEYELMPERKNDGRPNSKWTNAKHWNEIHEMVKEATEDAINADKFSQLRTSKIIARGTTAMGYNVEINGKYLDLSDSRVRYWSDDEEDDDGETLQTVSKYYITACIIQRSRSDEHDKKAIANHMQVRIDSFTTQHFRPVQISTSRDSSSHRKHSNSTFHTMGITTEAVNIPTGCYNLDRSAVEGSPTQSPCADTPRSTDDDLNWNSMPKESYYEERDDENNDNDSGHFGFGGHDGGDVFMRDVFPPEDDEELPDIDYTPMTIPTISPVREVSKSPRKRTTSGAGHSSRKRKERTSKRKSAGFLSKVDLQGGQRNALRKDCLNTNNEKRAPSPPLSSTTTKKRNPGHSKKSDASKTGATRHRANRNTDKEGRNRRNSTSVTAGRRKASTESPLPGRSRILSRDKENLPSTQTSSFSLGDASLTNANELRKEVDTGKSTQQERLSKNANRSTTLMANSPRKTTDKVERKRKERTNKKSTGSTNVGSVNKLNSTAKSSTAGSSRVENVLSSSILQPLGLHKSVTERRSFSDATSGSTFPSTYTSPATSPDVVITKEKVPQALRRRRKRGELLLNVKQEKDPLSPAKTSNTQTVSTIDPEMPVLVREASHDHSRGQTPPPLAPTLRSQNSRRNSWTSSISTESYLTLSTIVTPSSQPVVAEVPRLTPSPSIRSDRSGTYASSSSGSQKQSRILSSPTPKTSKRKSKRTDQPTSKGAKDKSDKKQIVSTKRDTLLNKSIQRKKVMDKEVNRKKARARSKLRSKSKTYSELRGNLRPPPPASQINTSVVGNSQRAEPTVSSAALIPTAGPSNLVLNSLASSPINTISSKSTSQEQSISSSPLPGPANIPNRCSLTSLGKLTKALEAIQINYGSDDDDEMSDPSPHSRSALYINDSELEKLGDKLMEIDEDLSLLESTESYAESSDSEDLFSFDTVEEPPQETPEVIHNSDSRPPSPVAGPSTSPPNMPPPQARPPRTPKKLKQIKQPDNSPTPARRIYVPDPQQEEALASIGIHKDPSKLTTLELAKNPHALQAGIYFCNQLINEETTVEQLSKKLNITTSQSSTPPPPHPRPLSPDITLVCSVRKAAKRGMDVATSSPALKIKQEGKGRKQADADDAANATKHEAALPLLRELICRTNETNTNRVPYVPQGDEYDLSQSSVCMQSLWHDYPDRSRSYKKRARRIRSLKEADITRLFNEKVGSLHNMLKGRITCQRFDLWKATSLPDGYSKMQDLRNMNVVTPFTEAQGNFVITLLEEREFVKNVTNSLRFGEFLNYVLLPEALIRIYAEVNRRSYEQAEHEMRNGATGIELE